MKGIIVEHSTVRNMKYWFVNYKICCHGNNMNTHVTCKSKKFHNFACIILYCAINRTTNKHPEYSLLVWLAAPHHLLSSQYSRVQMVPDQAT